ncbi:MAG: 16S rRNA (cytosine(1402)-N(4))-methyltransferase RsmH [Thermodesulfobacteriota bacterium]|nr:16S rRNA (cytosine(1402)-N(4))-methyltransferase RsmH [Thermodesulfobacteriota bacterium]
MRSRNSIEHIPVLVKEILEGLNCQPGGLYVDATLGSGGHSLEILKSSSPNGRLIGIDWDEEAIRLASSKLNGFQHRLTIVHDNFKNINTILMDLKVDAVDGVLLDLGVSSIQLGDKGRGFSFEHEGPIDMRMDRSSMVKAFDLINVLPVQELEQILWKYGEERFAKRIARSIDNHRKKLPISTTIQLADIVRKAMPTKHYPKRIDPATKTFQAIRIALNDELKNLETVIVRSIDHIKKGGRFCIISFHSLEDRIVKRSFRVNEGRCTCPPDMPQCMCLKEKRLKILTKKPITPSGDEKRKNPKSRTAKLRIAERL